MDLSSEYLGLQLKNPLVPSASPLSRSLDTARRLEDAGAAAIVMYSLFEEDIKYEEDLLDDFLFHQDIGHAEADSYRPKPDSYGTEVEAYLTQIEKLKQALSIPVIASLNGVSRGGWIEHARLIQQAGADALELNVYHVAANAAESPAQVEQRYLDILVAVSDSTRLPITMKLSSQFSALANFVQRLEAAGTQGVALFNRFYQPGIDLESLQVTPQLNLSSSADALLAMRWIAILRGQVSLSLAATGGIHTAEDALRMLLAGADVAHLCASLLQNGPAHLGTLLAGMEAWMLEHEYESVQQLKGSVSQQHAPDPSAYERANYLQVLQCLEKTY